MYRIIYPANPPIVYHETYHREDAALAYDQAESIAEGHKILFNGVEDTELMQEVLLDVFWEKFMSANTMALEQDATR